VNPANRQPQNDGTANGPVGMNANPTNNAANVNGTNNAARPVGQRVIPAQIVVARPPIGSSTGRLATRFERLSGTAGLEDVTVQSRGGKIILRGRVDSLEARRLASILARMEPGVDRVVNELEITRPYD